MALPLIGRQISTLPLIGRPSGIVAEKLLIFFVIGISVIVDPIKMFHVDWFSNQPESPNQSQSANLSPNQNTTACNLQSL
jgi:hypothetical protein